MKARTMYTALIATTIAAIAVIPSGGIAGSAPRMDAGVMNGPSPRAIVRFTHDVDDSTIRRLAAAGITHAVVIRSIDAVGVLGPKAAYAKIAAWPDVARVHDDARIRFDNYGAKKDTKVNAVRQGRAPLRTGYTGKGVTVAIVDTGIDTNHPDLADRVVKHVNFEPSWFMDMIHDGKYSDQLSEATGNPIDSYGHGTHVAGIVAGTGAAGKGADFSGVAPEATLVNLKIADAWQGVDCTIPCDIGWEMNALVAYEWMIEHRNDPAFPGGIRVANNSWSTTEVDSDAEPIVLIVREAARKGIVNVFSAGNSGPEDDTVGLGPNRLEEVITVGAVCHTADYVQTSTCKKGEIASFSSRGKQVDVAAPGVDIFSTLAWPAVYSPLGFSTDIAPGPTPADTAVNVARYGALSGTSMSAPHVSGIVALMIQANPRLPMAAVERILISTATDRGKRGFDIDYGYGVVDAFKAVVAAKAYKPPAPARKKR